ncbi:hypothetical protein O6H91_04G011500 [Diphasiastrum complanatum]|uniref:Uncharacterized protein n=1 Tax=Diphasiastrum complanatum TaxID=34168 RepID=A0ACC2DUA6_DIPCM|nr:hypothetical protein O6H91_04G011500 [Diphasiastrum complanatum]
MAASVGALKLISSPASLISASPCTSYLPFRVSVTHLGNPSSSFKGQHPGVLCMVKESVKEAKDGSVDADEVTQKYGLEVGLWKVFTSETDGDKDSKVKKTTQAKDLLTRYGGAYLATSITLSAISFSLCYFLISSGVDVASLLEKIGISTDATGERVGTLALAYAAHKAASPIRFPPTVALTPIVANWFGKASKEITAENIDQ